MLTHAGFLADETFLKGSVLSPTHPFLLAGILCGSCLLTWLGTRKRSTKLPLLPFAGAVILTLGAHTVWPRDTEALTWRQVNVVYENVRYLIRWPAKARTPQDAVVVRADEEERSRECAVVRQPQRPRRHFPGRQTRCADRQ